MNADNYIGLPLAEVTQEYSIHMKIKKANDFCIVLLQVTPSQALTNRLVDNIFGVNDKGNIVWQIEHDDWLVQHFPTMPYTGIYDKDINTVRCFHFSGYVKDIDVGSGKIVNEYFGK